MFGLRRCAVSWGHESLIALMDEVTTTRAWLEHGSGRLRPGNYNFNIWKLKPSFCGTTRQVHRDIHGLHCTEAHSWTGKSHWVGIWWGMSLDWPKKRPIHGILFLRNSVLPRRKKISRAWKKQETTSLKTTQKNLDFLIILLAMPAPVCTVSITKKSRDETSVRLFCIVPIVTVPDALFNSGTNLPHLK